MGFLRRNVEDDPRPTTHVFFPGGGGGGGSGQKKGGGGGGHRGGSLPPLFSFTPFRAGGTIFFFFFFLGAGPPIPPHSAQAEHLPNRKRSPVKSKTTNPSAKHGNAKKPPATFVGHRTSRRSTSLHPAIPRGGRTFFSPRSLIGLASKPHEERTRYASPRAAFGGPPPRGGATPAAGRFSTATSRGRVQGARGGNEGAKRPEGSGKAKDKLACFSGHAFDFLVATHVARAGLVRSSATRPRVVQLSHPHPTPSRMCTSIGAHGPVRPPAGADISFVHAARGKKKGPARLGGSSTRDSERALRVQTAARRWRLPTVRRLQRHHVSGGGGGGGPPTFRRKLTAGPLSKTARPPNEPVFRAQSSAISVEHQRRARG